MTPRQTKLQVMAAIQVCYAIRDTIKEAGEAGAPSGPLYAALMSHMTLDTYQRIISALKEAGVVRESNHVLYYTGEANNG